MRCAVIFNPTARGGKARRFIEALRGLDRELILKPTSGPGAASELAIEAAREGCEVVVAAGGDGTVNEVVDGLAREPAWLDQVCLGIVPLGTINVLARELGVPFGLEAAWRVIREGRETRIDLPQVTFTEEGQPRRRVFTQLAGAGLDSRAIALVNSKTKQRIGWIAYLLAGLRACRGPQPVVRVQGAGRETSGPLVVLGNGRRYGGDLGMFPEASLTDGQLEVRVFRRIGFGSLLRLGWAAIFRRSLAPADDVCLRGAEFRLACAEPLPFELDGDNVGWLPAHFTVQPGALLVRVPAQPAAQASKA